MGMLQCISIYPVGTMVRLNGDDMFDEPHRVIGYKSLYGACYLIFEDGATALFEKVEERIEK